MRRTARGVLAPLLAIGASHADVPGTDFDALAPGPYPFGAGDALELVSGDPLTVRVEERSGVPAAYRELATADWITSGRFLVVDTRDRQESTVLRVHFCCSGAVTRCALHYDQLSISWLGVSVSHSGALRGRMQLAGPCVARGSEDITVPGRTYVALDNFWTRDGEAEPATPSYGDRHGGDFLGPDFDSLAPGTFPLGPGSGVELLEGDASRLSIVPANPSPLGYSPFARHVEGNYLRIDGGDSSATVVALEFQVEKLPVAWTRMSALGIARSTTGIGVFADSEADTTNWRNAKAPHVYGSGVTCDLGTADGGRHRVIFRVGAGGTLCMRDPEVTLHARNASPADLARKAEAESLVTAVGATEAWRRAVDMQHGDREERLLAPVLALAARGRGTALWKELGWWRTARGVASTDGKFWIVQTSSFGEFGPAGESLLSLLDIQRGPLWTRPGMALFLPAVSREGTVLSSRPSGDGFAVEAIDVEGNVGWERQWTRATRGRTDDETIAMSPDETMWLVTVAVGKDWRATTDVYALDRSGEPLWETNVGAMNRAPTIEFRQDGRRILVHDLSFHGGTDRLVVLATDGTRIASHTCAHAFSPRPDELYFDDGGLKHLDLRTPDHARRVPSEELYPFLLDPDVRTHGMALRLLFRRARSRFDEDPALMGIVDAMRVDPLYAHAIQQMEYQLELERTGEREPEE